MPTRFDEPYVIADRRLAAAVLANDTVQEDSRRRGGALPGGPRGRTREHGPCRTPGRAAISAALRGVLSYDEVDRYAREIARRRAKGTRPRGRAAFRRVRITNEGAAGGARKRRGPDARTIDAAAASTRDACAPLDSASPRSSISTTVTASPQWLPSSITTARAALPALPLGGPDER